jgi:UDP-N-acetylglucosamine 2-epimerase (non-hydrolysing)
MITDPFGYLDFLCLEMNAKFLLTDSGGLQEESTFFGIPCLTLRENTERPVTVTQGTNILVGTDPTRIVEETLDILKGNGKRGEVPELWDEGVAQRIVEVLSG